MPAPEINVRLTADGVQDVVNAFRRVQQEAGKTGKEIGILGEAGQQLKELIPLVSIGLVVEKMVEMGKAALDSAIDLGRMSEKTGASAGTLSVLAMAAHDVGVNQDELSMSLVKLARAQEMASQGSKQQQLAFKSLGISLADIRSKDPGALFVEIAQKMAAMPDGATKAAVSMTLFGRAGAQLIPVMNEIGQADGFEQAKERAKELGIYLSDGMVADAKKAEKAIKDLQDVSEGFALKFVSGFAPQMTAAVESFSAAVTGSGGDGVKELGEDAGIVVLAIVRGFLTLGDTIALVFELIKQGAATVAETTAKLLKTAWNGVASGASVAAQLMIGDFTGAATTAGNAIRGIGSDLRAAGGSVRDGLTGMGGIWAQFVKDENAIWPQGKSTNLVQYLREHFPSKPNPSGADGSGESDADREKKLKQFQKWVDAKAAYEDQVSTDELAKQKLRDQQANAEDKAMYDQGLISLNQYYDARSSRINQEAAAEEAILKQKLANEVNAAAQLLGKDAAFVKSLIGQGSKAIEAAAVNNPQALKMLQTIAATQAQIDEDEMKRQNQIFENNQQRIAAAKAATDQELSNRQKLYELQGMTSQAQQVALEKELLDTDELLKKLGMAEEQRMAILDRVRANAMAQSQMGALSNSGGNALASLQVGVSDIQDRASAGAISEMQAVAEIYKLEKDRLPVLQQISSEMQNVVDAAAAQLLYLTPGSDEYKAQLQIVEDLEKEAEAYGKQVAKISTSLTTTKSFAVELQNVLMTQGAGALTTFFDDIGTGSKSAEQAFADLGKSFEAMIVHMIDQMIIYYALMALVGWVAPNSSLFTSLQKSGPFGGKGFSGGGYTGRGSPNGVAGVVHKDEYVFDSPAVRRIGLPLLDAMRAGTVGGVNAASSFAGSSSGAGGDAGGGDSGPLVQVNVDSGGNPVTQTQRQGPGGMNIIDVIIGRVASDISGGGKVGQTIQSTYNVSRKGTRRG